MQTQINLRFSILLSALNYPLMPNNSGQTIYRHSNHVADADICLGWPCNITQWGRLGFSGVCLFIFYYFMVKLSHFQARKAYKVTESPCRPWNASLHCEHSFRVMTQFSNWKRLDPEREPDRPPSLRTEADGSGSNPCAQSASSATSPWSRVSLSEMWRPTICCGRCWVVRAASVFLQSPPVRSPAAESAHAS